MIKKIISLPSWEEMEPHEKAEILTIDALILYGLYRLLKWMLG